MKKTSSICDTCKHQSNKAWEYPCPLCDNGSRYTPFNPDDNGATVSCPVKSPSTLKLMAITALSVSIVAFWLAIKLAVMTTIMWLTDYFIFHNFNNSFQELIQFSLVMVLLFEYVENKLSSVSSKVYSKMTGK